MNTNTLRHRGVTSGLTISFPPKKIESVNVPSYYNKVAFLGAVISGLFVLYFILPHEGAVFSFIFGSSLLYLIILPMVAIGTSIFSLRQIYRRDEHGAYLNYLTLSIMSLYFSVILAIPLVVLGLYLLYSIIR